MAGAGPATAADTRQQPTGWLKRTHLEAHRKLPAMLVEAWPVSKHIGEKTPLKSTHLVAVCRHRHGGRQERRFGHHVPVIGPDPLLGREVECLKRHFHVIHRQADETGSLKKFLGTKQKKTIPKRRSVIFVEPGRRPPPVDWVPALQWSFLGFGQPHANQQFNLPYLILVDGDYFGLFQVLAKMAHQ